MYVVAFVAGLLLSIAIGFWRKVNAGYVAIVCAFVIGIFLYGFSVKEVVGLWPVSLFLMLFSVMLFYGFAIANGTIESLASHIAWATRKHPALLPFALWLFCMAIAASGAGPYAVFAFLAPIVMSISIKSGMSRLLAAVVVISGGSIGGQCPISVGGIVIQNYATLVGYGDQALAVSVDVFLNALICQGLIFVSLYVFFKGWKASYVVMEEPEPLSRQHKTNLVIIGVVLLLTIVPPFLRYFVLPENEFILLLSGAMDVTVTSSIGIVLCLLCGVGSEKAAFSKMPWNTIFLICGIGLLIQTAVKFGVVDDLSAWISANVSGSGAIYALILASVCMSFFSSTLGVVVPSLSTLVPVFSSITGFGPGYLFSLLTVPALLTGYSPFSSAGAITMAGVPDEAERQSIFKVMLAAPFVLFVFFCALTFIGVIR